MPRHARPAFVEPHRLVARRSLSAVVLPSLVGRYPQVVYSIAVVAVRAPSLMMVVMVVVVVMVMVVHAVHR
jgi:hypothetical protein